MKKHLNWFTLLSLGTLIVLIVLGVYTIVATDVTLDILSAGVIMAAAAITTAILSLHDS